MMSSAKTTSAVMVGSSPKTNPLRRSLGSRGTGDSRALGRRSAQWRASRGSKIDVPRHFLVSKQPAVLQRIATSGINLCVWARPAEAQAAVAVNAILSARNRLRLDLAAPTPERIAACIIECLIRPAPRVREAVLHLTKDIALLATKFGTVADIRHPRVRLTRVEDNCCALFHVDNLRLRMLCTYAGAGTQWLENHDVRRAQLGTQGRTLPEATQAIVVDPAAIHTIPGWHVAVLKGGGWPGEERTGVVHRSAPVSNSASHRLVLCVDLPAACAC
jgi:hypothetical protein